MRHAKEGFIWVLGVWMQGYFSEAPTFVGTPFVATLRIQFVRLGTSLGTRIEQTDDIIEQPCRYR